MFGKKEKKYKYVCEKCGYEQNPKHVAATWINECDYMPCPKCLEKLVPGLKVKEIKI